MRRYSITDKFIIASFVISMIIIVVVASYSFFKAKNAVLERTFNQLHSVRYIKTELLQNFFNNCKKDIRIIGKTTEIYHLATQRNDYTHNQDSLQIVRFTNPDTLAFIKDLNPENYYSIYLLTNTRKIYLLKAPKTPRIPKYYAQVYHFLDSIPSLIWTDYKNFDSVLKPVSISQNIRLRKNKKEIGKLVFEISPQALDNIMLNNNISSGLGLSGESYLIGKDRLMRSTSRFNKKSVLHTRVNTQAATMAFQTHLSSVIGKDYRGVKVLSSFEKINIPYLDWALLAEIDYKEATIPIYKIRYEIIFISIFIFLIVLIIVIALSKKITQPIEKLNEAVHEISKGNLDVKLHYANDDEIGELTRTFNLMTRELKNKNNELETERIKSMRSLIDGQEIERQRLSRELHDSLGQLLIALKLKHEVGTAKEELAELFDQTIEETRRISNNLMPSALEEFGLRTALRNICNDVTENTDIQVQLKINGNLKVLDLETKIYLFRIIQEAVTNTIKHAHATKLIIQITRSGKIINLHIEDNGSGFDTPIKPKKNSNGINNIKDRVALLQGEIRIISGKNKGTQIHIKIPNNK